MDLEKLYHILDDATTQFRKGDLIEKTDIHNLGVTNAPIEITNVYMMEHENNAPESLEMIDMHFISIGVDKEKAEKHKEELLNLLDDLINTGKLNDGPSYIIVGAAIRSQDMAFKLFALGKVLKLWEVITPKTFGLSGETADEAAGHGFIMISGYKPK